MRRKPFRTTSATYIELGVSEQEVRAVDVQIRNKNDSFNQGLKRQDRGDCCPQCGFGHGVKSPCFVVLPYQHHPERNGEYKGTAPVRVIPPGITGADLVRKKHDIAPKHPRTIRVGQLWENFEGHVGLVRRVGHPFATLTLLGEQRKVLCSLLLDGKRWKFLSDGTARQHITPGAVAQRERE